MLLWDVLARSSAVLMAAALTNAALRGRSAALRHAVWACGLAGALAVAPLSWVLPTWHVPLVPAFVSRAPEPSAVAAPQSPAAAAIPAARLTPAPASEAPAAPPRSAQRRTRALTQPAGPVSLAAETADLAPAVPSAAPPAGDTVAAAPAAANPVARIPWGLTLMGIWALGTLLLLGRIGLANVATFRALRTRTGAPAPWLATARRLAHVSGVPGTHFVRAEAITMPMAAGYLRPTVALPAEADAWPDERVTSVLLHELAHIRRRDCLTQLAASTTCALYWMNPLAWYAARALRRERERACDDAVLVAGTAGPTYAEHLLDVARAARHVTTPTWSGGVAMAHRSELEGRLMAILDDARNRQSVSYGAAGLAGLLCLALVTPLAALDPWALSAAEAQPLPRAIPPGAGPAPKAPKAPRPAVAPVAIPAPMVDVVAPAALAALPDLDAELAAPVLAPDVPEPPAPPMPATPVAYAVTRVAPAIAVAPGLRVQRHRRHGRPVAADARGGADAVADADPLAHAQYSAGRQPQGASCRTGARPRRPARHRRPRRRPQGPRRRSPAAGRPLARPDARPGRGRSADSGAPGHRRRGPAERRLRARPAARRARHPRAHHRAEGRQRGSARARRLRAEPAARRRAPSIRS